ncbi:MAG: YebC/PmpR family DNA-binding transcriptional regulator, partial [Arsenophonus sp. NC-QC1-MAG3]
NHTVSDVRHAFTKCGGNLSTDGSAAYLFTKRGVISYSAGIDEDDLIEAALEAGADDLKSYNNGAIDIYTTLKNFGHVKDTLDKAGFKAEIAEITMISSTKATLDTYTAPKLLRLIDMLEDFDDVQEVYHNAEISV